MRKHDDRERLYETRRQLVIALDNGGRVWIWDLPSQTEPIHEEWANIVPTHVLAAADRIGLNVWRGRCLAVQKGWMTKAGTITPKGRRLAVEQGWRDTKGNITEREKDVLDSDGGECDPRILYTQGGRIVLWSPLMANPRVVRTWNGGGRGRKQCPMCRRYLSAGTARCSCGVNFKIG